MIRYIVKKSVLTYTSFLVRINDADVLDLYLFIYFSKLYLYAHYESAFQYKKEEIFIVSVLLCEYECSCTIVAYFIILSALWKARDRLRLSEMIARYPKISNRKKWNARELWMMFQASRLVRFHENFTMMIDESDHDFGFTS